jgi:hypothetical protein
MTVCVCVGGGVEKEVSAPTSIRNDCTTPHVNTVVVGIKRSFEQVIASDVSLFGETSGILRIQ